MVHVQSTGNHEALGIKSAKAVSTRMFSRAEKAKVHPPPTDQEHPCLTCSPAGGPFAEAQWHPEKLPVLHQRSITLSKLPHPSTNTGDPLA